jgi:hypothetical protein
LREADERLIRKLLFAAVMCCAVTCCGVLCPVTEGDTLRTWRIDPFIMVEGGQAWVPPPMLAADIAAGED